MSVCAVSPERLIACCRWEMLLEEKAIQIVGRLFDIKDCAEQKPL